MKKRRKEFVKAWLKEATEKVWRGTKGKLAVLMAACILFGGIAEYHFEGVHAEDANASEYGYSSVSGNQNNTVSGNGENSVSGKEESAVEAADEELLAVYADEIMVLAAASGPIDRTDDTEEVGLEISGLTFYDKNGNSISGFSTETIDNNTVYDLTAANTSIYSLGGISYTMTLKILNNNVDAGTVSADQLRKVCGGDYITLSIPEGFTAASSLKNASLTTSDGTVVANCTLDETNNVLKVTFTDIVNYSEGFTSITGGLYMQMTFDADKSNERTVTLLEKTASREGVVLKLPENPNMVSGITKAGSFDASTGMITWTIGIGTDSSSSGVNLAGLVIKDVLSDDESGALNTCQIFPGSDGNNGLSYKLTDNSGEYTDDVSYTENGDGSLSFTISDKSSIKAPAYLTVTTGITGAALEKVKALKENDSNAQITVYNTAAMEQGSSNLTIDEKAASITSSVDLNFDMGYSKSGEQVDSNTIHWTIVVNEKADVNTYCGEVIDTLGPEFQYDGNLKVNGSIVSGAGLSAALTDENDWGEGFQYYVAPYNGTDGQKLYFYLPKYSKSKYIIEFDVKTTDKFDENPGLFVGDGDNQGKISNEVEIKAKLPSFDGDKPMELVFGTPTGYSSFDMSMIKKTGSGDETTGLITWTLYPSTRNTNYGTAVITDAIRSGRDGSDEQSYVENSCIIYLNDAEYITSASNDYANWVEYNPTTKTLTITIPESVDQKLGEYKIEYQTQADAFLHSNYEQKTFSNVAELQVGTNPEVLSNEAKVSMKNEFAYKNTFVEYGDDGKPYFHYEISVNHNHMKELHNVKIEDAISNIIFYDSKGGEINDISDLWEFDVSKCTLEVLSSGSPNERYENASANSSLPAGIMVTFADRDSVTAEFDKIEEKEYILHLYVCLKDTAGNVLENSDLRDKKIHTANTAKVTSDEVNGGNINTPLSVANSNWAELDNRSTIKSYTPDGAKTTWRVEINPNGGTLNNASVVDVINKDHKYDKDSIVLYRASRGNDGKLTYSEADRISLASSEEEAKGGCYYEITVDTDGRQLMVTLPNDSNAYVLLYDTIIADTSKTSVSNSVKLHNDGNDYAEAKAERKQSGGAWASMISTGNLKITALDTSVAAALSMEGVKIAVYSDEACKDADMEDIGVTEGTGELTFYGLDAGGNDQPTTYYVKIVSVPEGYELDTDTVYEVPVIRGRTAPLEIKNERTSDANTTAEIQKEFLYYNTLENKSAEISGKQAEFALYYYPSVNLNNVTGDNMSSMKSGSRLPVYFTCDSVGTYAYSNNSSEERVTALSTDHNGKLTLKGLPWGYYVLEETKTAEGFAVDNAAEYCFVVRRSTAGTDETFSVEYGFANGSITNESTEFSVRDIFKSGTAEIYVPGVELQILNVDDGSVVTDALNNNAEYAWTTGTGNHTVYNLPAGTYKLHAVPETVPMCYRSVDDITFTVNRDGTLSVANTEADGTIDAAAKLLTMFNDTLSLNIAKVDQFRHPVSGAALTLEGAMWNTSSNAAESSSITWNTDGNVKTVKNLVRGETYTLTETTTPDGYKTAYAVELSVNHDGSFSVKCVDQTSGAQLDISSNASYYENDTLYVVDANQSLLLKLQKTDAVTGENISGAKFDLYVKADSSESADADNCILEGLTVMDDGAGNCVWDLSSANSITSDKAGYDLREGLKPGTYYLKETAAPAGYVWDSSVKIYFRFTEDGRLVILDDSKAYAEADGETVKIKNAPLTLRILPCEFDNKIDEGLDHKTPLDGLDAAYTVKGVFLNEDGTASDIEITLDDREAGMQENALMGRLIAGQVYEITETTPPDGYRAQRPVYVRLDADGTAVLVENNGDAADDYSMTVNDESQLGGDGKAAQVLIYHGQTQAYIEKLTSWDAANGKLLEDEADYKAFAGVTFILSGSFPEDVTTGDSLELTTDAEGKISLKGKLIDGETYTLKEETVTGYSEISEIKFTYDSASAKVITIAGDSDTARAYIDHDKLTICIINDSGQNTALSFNVIDCTDESGLSGVRFMLEKLDGNGNFIEVKELTTDAEGKKYSYVYAGGEETITTAEGQCFVTGLEPGDYRLTQISTVSGYDMAADDPVVVTFTVDKNSMNRIIYIDKDTVESGSFGMDKSGTPLVTAKGICNKRIAGTVIIQKVDADNDMPINGVEYTIYRYRNDDSISEKLYNLFTGKSYAVATGSWTEEDIEAGFLEITGLEWGRYYIQETKAAPGYKLDDTKYEFEIGKNSGTFVIEFTGEGKLTNAKIQSGTKQPTEDASKTVVSQSAEAAASRTALLPQTGREVRAIYMIFGILLVAAGIGLIAGKKIFEMRKK